MKNESEFQSHPLKWLDLLDVVKKSELKNPDVWIEDFRKYGACEGRESIVVCEDEETQGVEASFSVIRDVLNNRIIIRHHY